MKEIKTILKKLSALALLAVFIFIHVVKAFHTHSSHATTYSAGATVDAGKDCAICDYHLTKDADCPTIALQPVKESYYTHFITTYQTRLTSSIGLSYSDRGPPAHT